jgi:hypothetical protein
MLIRLSSAARRIAFPSTLIAPRRRARRPACFELRGDIFVRSADECSGVLNKPRTVAEIGRQVGMRTAWRRLDRLAHSGDGRLLASDSTDGGHSVCGM